MPEDESGGGIECQPMVVMNKTGDGGQD